MGYENKTPDGGVISLGFDRPTYPVDRIEDTYVLFLRTKGGLTKGPFLLSTNVLPDIEGARSIMQREAETTGVAPAQAIVVKVGRKPHPAQSVPPMEIVHWWNVHIENVPTIHVSEV